MAFKKEGLVESIFTRPPSQKRKSSPLFRSFPAIKPSSSFSREALISGVKVDKRFAIGLDIGPSLVKWVQLGAVGGKTCLIKAGCAPLEFTGISEDKQKEAAGVQLRQIAAQYFLSSPVVLSFPLEEVNLKVFRIPPVSEEELESAVRWQLEQTFSAQTKYEDLSVDSVFLEGLSTEKERRVLVATVPRHRILSLLTQAGQAGLGPVLAIEIDSFAVASAFARQGIFESGKTDLLLYLGGRRSSMSVIVQSQVVFSRPLPVKGAGLTNAVSDFCRVPRTDAEQLKQTYGLAGTAAPTSKLLTETDQNQAHLVAQALSSPMENLFVEIVHSFKSFSYQIGQSLVQQFDRVLLCGSMSGLPGIASYLETRFGVPVKTVDLLENIPSLPGQKKPEAAVKYHLEVAAGLARGEMSA